jgi:ATP-dependent Lon protease
MSIDHSINEQKKTNRKMKINSKNEIKINENVVIGNFISDHLLKIQEIITNTLISIEENSKYKLFSKNELNHCMNSLHELYKKISIYEINENTNKEAQDNIVNVLQETINQVTPIISKYGTKNVKDILYICFGSDFQNLYSKFPLLNEKFELIKKYIHPTGFKIITLKKTNDITDDSLCLNKITENVVTIENSPQFECFDIDVNVNVNNFFEKICGIQTIIHNFKTGKSIIMKGWIDNINITFFSNKYILKRKNNILLSSPNTPYFDIELLNRQLDSFTIKDLLVYGDTDIYIKNSQILNSINSMKISNLDTIIKKFVALELYEKRNQLIEMILFSKDHEIQYLSYLLYDLINQTNTDIDTNDQEKIYNSFSWKIKQYFKDVMKNTIQYNENTLEKYDNNRISLEQRVLLLHVNDTIKSKAIIKLKEYKSKIDDAGSKAKQYLEGLLQIPFENYKKEPILHIVKKINNIFSIFIKDLKNTIFRFDKDNQCVTFEKDKSKYTIYEIKNHVIFFKNELQKKIMLLLNSTNIIDLNKIFLKINNNNTNETKRQTKEQKIIKICKYITEGQGSHDIKEKLYQNIKNEKNKYEILEISKNYIQINKIMRELETSYNMIENIKIVLEESIHGHNYAKNQILKIICQWINGSQTGYCFGFEGSPGIGKTSLAKKGLAKCLVDENGEPRPFSFIAMGGSCNGSTIEGHSYTYLNSTWGKIVEILMECKCMNPIIYIDELDKISKTENGKEIVGILTHLIDPSQNEHFQDKYFSGIPIDVSKALFIFSYNDADQIDRILLDRIHRIKFDNLSLKEKIVIVNKFILPEINEKMGFENIIKIDENTVQYIIEEYTSEPGVRKLKEILFDLYGEINIELLTNDDSFTMNLPITITKELLNNKYFKKHQNIQETKIHPKNEIGIMNGLWANSLGRGGVIPIEVMFFPSDSFLELKLTGLQGNVMKESMNIAKTLAWSYCSENRIKDLIDFFDSTKSKGIHIHCPEGSINKDGPSAGAAIFVAIYSRLNNFHIKNNIAITGEINLQGNVSAIGSLEYKILGGIKAGITCFLFPKDNEKDFIHFIQKMIENKSIENFDLKLLSKNTTFNIDIFEKNITFVMIETVYELFKYVFSVEIKEIESCNNNLI